MTNKQRVRKGANMKAEIRKIATKLDDKFVILGLCMEYGTKNKKSMFGIHTSPTRNNTT